MVPPRTQWGGMDDLEKAARRLGALENGRFALRPFAYGPGWQASHDNAEILSTIGTLRPLTGSARAPTAEAVADLERTILAMPPGGRVVVGARRGRSVPSTNTVTANGTRSRP